MFDIGYEDLDGLQTNDYCSLAGGIFTHSSMFLEVTGGIIAAQLVGTEEEIMTSVNHLSTTVRVWTSLQYLELYSRFMGPILGDITLLLVSGIAGGSLRLPVFTAD